MEDSHLSHTKKAQRNQEWITQISEGNEEAFKKLFLKYYNGLCRFSSSMIRSPFLAEEIVQEVFAKVWETRKSLDANGNIKAYLYQAVKNKTYDWLEKKKIEGKYLDEFALQNDEVEEENELTQKEEQFIREVQNAVEELPNRAQLIYKLHKKEGLTYKEIAQIMGISVKTVESQMGRALKLIRIYLAKISTIIITSFLFY